ncbi:unnamed protein product [Sphenostylis stenocarpa]|uniref:QWRF motif-containing protein 3 n=1 Tax=Sphenostylis stenocarpa TaxID=92480 RepID=A0AA87BAX1_9FABA|nr:unnamed protein product [Sphenostylis stenocarpa]
MKSDSNDSVSPYSPKRRTRFVSSRFMSPNSTASPDSSSPLRRFNRPTRKDSTTLAYHIGNERLKEREENHQHHNQKPTNRTDSVFSALTKQRSCREYRNNNNFLEENDQDQDQDVAGRSTKNDFSVKSSSRVVKKTISHLDPGRLSLDENTFKGNFHCDKNPIDSESENTSLDSVSLQRTFSSRKLGRDVPSKYMAVCGSGRRGEASDSDPLSCDDSWMMKKFMTQKTGKKANSLIGYMSSKSQWALSPGRSGSPPLSLESKDKQLSFSSMRPPQKRVEKILSMGFDFFRTKKSSSINEVVHQLRLLQNRLIQWRFANARAQAVNHSISLQTESNLINVLDGLTKLRHSVMRKKIELEREKLKMKLNFLLHSQMKMLESWGSMERQHLAAVTTMKECLHSVICRVPLSEGAKVDIQLASIAQRYASDLTDSIESVLSSFSPLANKTSELISNLARIVAQEKLLLQELNDVFHDMCVLEMEAEGKEPSMQSHSTPILKIKILETAITAKDPLNQKPHSLPGTWNWRELGRVVSFKYMARSEGDSDGSWMVKTHKATKKTNNFVLGYVGSKYHWALSHGHIILRPPQPIC